MTRQLRAGRASRAGRARPRALSGLVGLSSAGWLLATAACLPSFEDRPWLVEEARVLAVRSIPAEAEPGTQVSYEALVASPGGEGATTLSWAFCTQPRRAEERGAVSRACALGEALEPTPNPAMLPTDVCARFGPNAPPTQADEPERRPTDPDASGGYAIPVHVEAGEGVDAFGRTRIRCDLVGATRPVFDAFEARYENNKNPELDALEAVLGEGLGTAALGEGPVSAAPGAAVGLRLRTASGAAEPYVLYELERGSLRDIEESLSVRWYVSAGELERASQHAGPGPSDTPLSFETTWLAPLEPSLVRGWVVVSDERGGTSWLSFELLVEA